MAKEIIDNMPIYINEQPPQGERYFIAIKDHPQDENQVIVSYLGCGVWVTLKAKHEWRAFVNQYLSS